MIRVSVRGIGLLGPGLAGWAAARQVLRGDRPHALEDVILPPVTLLPAAERRRTGASVKLALAVGLEAVAQSGDDIAEMATVFTSSGSDSQTIHAILEELATDRREVSPTRFHNSVHNAPSGYWAVACAARAPSTSLCAHDASFQSGLLDAAVQAVMSDRPVTLIAYDLPYVGPLHDIRPIGGTFAIALVLAPHAGPGPGTIATLEIETAGPSVRATQIDIASLEALRRDIPAGRALPLLMALAGSQPSTHHLVAPEGHALTITTTPA